MIEFKTLVDLASARLGGRALEANDEFFASKSNLLKPANPIFIEGKFTSRGKWMDGWETRRRRTPGHDWCIIRLGLAGIVRGVLVDTTHFKGNYPARFSLEALELAGGAPYPGERPKLKAAENSWVELHPETPLAGDSRNEFAVSSESRFTHLRLKIYPDGGVARLRVFGEVVPDPAQLARPEIDLVSIGNGGRPIRSSDEFFGVPLNLLLPGPGKDMGDGWETRRRRGPGYDWTILKLGVPGDIRRVEAETTHFKGNFPESCSLEGCYANGSSSSNSEALWDWKEFLPRTKLKAHSRHTFCDQLVQIGPVTHVRFNIYPDGGVSRLRLFGQPQAQNRPKGTPWLNGLSQADARKAFLDCCGSAKWGEQMLSCRPFAGADELFEAADRIWSTLDQKDWLEAFGHHPPIGGNKAASKQSDTARQWSKGEQSRAQVALEETRAQLAQANQSYQSKFGTVFLICATGKTAEEILSSLRVRLSNNSETERHVAAEEQRKITRIRLEKPLSS
jgi:allantoicase